MQSSETQDIKRLNLIIKSLSNMKKAFDENDIQSSRHLVRDELTQLICTQLITNIHEYKEKLRQETKDKLVGLNKIRLGTMRHISSHFYESVDFDIVYDICRRLMKADILAELYNVLAELEKPEGDEND